MADIDYNPDYDPNKKRCNKKDCFECSIFWNKKAEEHKSATMKTDKQLIDTL